MAEIRVSTEDLRTGSQTLQHNASDLGAVKARLQAAVSGLDPGMYRGQFVPKVQGIASRAASAAQGYENRSHELEGELTRRALLFEAANDISSGKIAGASAQLRDFPRGAPTVDLFSRYAHLDLDTARRILALIGTIGLYPFPVTVFALLAMTPGGRAAIGAANDYLLPPVTPPQRVTIGGTFGFIGREHKLWPTRRGRPEKNKPSADLKLAIVKSKALYGKEGEGATRLGGLRAGWRTSFEVGKVEAGVGAAFKGKEKIIGGYAGITGAEAKASGVLGDKNLGLGAGIAVTGAEAEILAGLKNGRLGAKIGGSLISAEGTVGLNVAGWNVGVTGGIGVQFQIGLEVGKKTKVYFGPFEIGLNIGEALGS